jgi:hypothetical protein
MTTAASSTCCACGKPALPDQEDPRGLTELRPYGPEGAPICFACAMKPENRDETDRQFDKVLDAAEDVSRADGAHIAHVELTPHGPRGIKTGRA